MKLEQGRHYNVTGWDNDSPAHIMRVWTDTVTPTMIKGHVSSKGYPLVDTCVWTTHLANTWIWVEVGK